MNDRPSREDLGSVPIWPPVEGHYAVQLVKGGPRVAIRIWFGRPVIGGEEQDRAPRWNVEVDGQSDRWDRDKGSVYRCRVAHDIHRYWPFCAKDPISEAEHRFLIADAEHARKHRPNDPKANPRQPVNFNTLLPF